jgi:hypothetical protein
MATAAPLIKEGVKELYCISRRIFAILKQASC